MGNNIKSIGEWAFRNCKSLKSIVIPSSVLNIDECAFVDCCKGLTLCVRVGSDSQAFVEEYASDNGLKFKALDSENIEKTNNVVDDDTAIQPPPTGLSTLRSDEFKGKGFLLGDDCSDTEKTMLRSVLKRYGASVKRSFSKNVDYFVTSYKNLSRVKNMSAELEQAVKQNESTGKPVIINPDTILDKERKLVANYIASMSKEDKFEYALSLYDICKDKVDKMAMNDDFIHPFCSDRSVIRAQLREGAQVSDASDFLHEVAEDYDRYYSLYEKAFEPKGCSLYELYGTDFAIALSVAAFVFGSTDSQIYVEWYRNKWELRGDFEAPFLMAFTLDTIYSEGRVSRA
jgi:hypothetical protein